jgi:hypothetical protein
MLASRVIKIEQPRTRHQGSGQVCRPPLASSFPAANKASISCFPAAFLPGSGQYVEIAVTRSKQMAATLLPGARIAHFASLYPEHLRRAACPEDLRRCTLLQDAHSASLCSGTACCAHFSVAYSSTVEQAIQKRPLALGFCSRFFPNCDNLNRQTHEFRNAVTYRKQKTVNCSNRQNIQKWSSVFSPLLPPARISPRTNAPTENEL